MAFYRMKEINRGCGIETEAETRYTRGCLVWANEYVRLAHDGFSNKWNVKLKESRMQQHISANDQKVCCVTLINCVSNAQNIGDETLT